MTLVPIIDDGACLAHGDCAALAPDVFAVEGDVGVVISDGPDDLLFAGVFEGDGELVAFRASQRDTVFLQQAFDERGVVDDLVVASELRELVPAGAIVLLDRDTGEEVE